MLISLTRLSLSLCSMYILPVFIHSLSDRHLCFLCVQHSLSLRFSSCSELSLFLTLRFFYGCCFFPATVQCFSVVSLPIIFYSIAVIFLVAPVDIFSLLNTLNFNWCPACRAFGSSSCLSSAWIHAYVDMKKVVSLPYNHVPRSFMLVCPDLTN